LKSRKRNNRFSFQVSVNGTLFIKFKHRMRPEDITHLRLYGDIEPQKLEYRSKSIIIPPRGSLNVLCVNHVDRKCLVFFWRLLIRNGILLPKLFRPTVRKIVLVIEITRTIYLNSERSKQLLVTECFFNLFLEVSQTW
jgi:hypothetical protein